MASLLLTILPFVLTFTIAGAAPVSDESRAAADRCCAHRC
jgi:hypothetical protein